MALRDIIGHEHAIGILRGCITRNRIAHAYMFTGEDGIGKRLTAINFAKALNCQKTVTSYKLQGTSKNPKSEIITIDSCDKCPSCIKIDKLFHPEDLINTKDEEELKKMLFISHPDVVLVKPYKGEIRIEIIRRLEEFLAYKAFEGRWKMVIIDEAETLNQSAANAFLKTLEEPPGQSVLILISSMPKLIPETILSRCFRINFSPLPISRLNELLRPGDQESRAMLLSALSAGKPARILNGSLFEMRDRLFDAFKTLMYQMKDDLWEGRDSMEEWFDWVHLWIRDIAVWKATNRTDLLINQDLRQEIMDISKKAELNDILRLSRIFYRIKESLRFNLNKKITLYHTHCLLKETFGRNKNLI